MSISTPLTPRANNSGSYTDYKLGPTATQAEDIKSRFQTMCSTKTAYATLCRF
jgi:hypothetical protein